MRIFDDETPTDYQGVAKRMTQSLVESGLISDQTVGGVAQILVETIAREMATFYAMLEKAHEAGYLATARGRALDNVTALLGIRRATSGLLRGKVKFSRRTPASKDIVIPAGIMIAGPPLEDGPVPPMETVEQDRILHGRHSVMVDIQEIPGTEPSGIRRLPAGALSFMPRPLLGVDAVTNPEPIVQGGQEESDDYLRARAGVVLRESQKGTIEAIEAAVRKRGIEAVQVKEVAEQRGCLEVRVGNPELETNQKLQDEVKEDIQSAKAAGIHVEVKFLKSVYCHIVATIEPEAEYAAGDAFDRLALGLKQDLTAYTNGLAPGTSIARRKLDAILMGNPKVQNAKVDLRMFQYDSSSPGNFTMLDGREFDDHWQIKELERAAVDPQRWPVEIVSRHKPNSILYFAATVPGPQSEISQKQRQLSEVMEEFIRRLRQKGAGGIPPKVALDYTNLVYELINTHLEVELRYAWIVHQASGEVDYWTEDHWPVLAEGEPMSLGRIDLKPKEGR